MRPAGGPGEGPASGSRFGRPRWGLWAQGPPPTGSRCRASQSVALARGPEAGVHPPGRAEVPSAGPAGVLGLGSGPRGFGAEEREAARRGGAGRGGWPSPRALSRGWVRRAERTRGPALGSFGLGSGRGSRFWPRPHWGRPPLTSPRARRRPGPRSVRAAARIPSPSRCPLTPLLPGHMVPLRDPCPLGSRVEAERAKRGVGEGRKWQDPEQQEMT